MVNRYASKKRHMTNYEVCRNVVGKGQATVASFIDNIINEHFAIHAAEIRLHLMRDSRHIASNNNFSTPMKRKTTAKISARHWIHKSASCRMSKKKYQPPDGIIQSPRHRQKRFMNKKTESFFCCDDCRSRIWTFAQGNGLAGINEGNKYGEPPISIQERNSSTPSVPWWVSSEASRCMAKFSSGEGTRARLPQAGSGACIFLIVSATILRSFFL